MDGQIWAIVIVSIIIIYMIISWLSVITSNSKKYLELKPKLDNLEKSINDHEEEVRDWK